MHYVLGSERVLPRKFLLSWNTLHVVYTCIPPQEEQEHVKRFVFIVGGLITEKQMGPFKNRHLY